MVFAFARDRGLPASHMFDRIHKSSDMFRNALCISVITTSLFGCIFLISTTAFFAISSASVVTLTISYALPIVIHCAQGRNKLGPRAFALPSALGWMVNGVGVTYAVLTSVMFLLPPKLPVTMETTNYGGVVLALVLVFSVASWISGGKEYYLGPAMLRHNEGLAGSSFIDEDDEESISILRSRDN